MTSKIELAISKGKLQGARKLLEEYYLAEDKRVWTSLKQEEYDTLFKTVVVEVPEELDEEGNVVTEASSYLEYIEDCISFNDWLNETRVITEEVEEVSHIEVIDGIETVVIDTPYQPEVTELVRPYIASGVSQLVEDYISNHSGLQAKDKQERLNTIVVTTSNGNSFDGNESARLNMTNAIIASDVVGQTETNWKLADNTTKVVALQELKEALVLATIEVGKIVGAVK